MYKLNSKKLLNIYNVKSFAKNINFYKIDKNYKKNYNFYGCYYLLVDKYIVEKVFNNDFFLISYKHFNPLKYKEEIFSNLINGKYLLYSRDYIGFLLKYIILSNLELNIGYGGQSIFWIYHDIGHVYLGHLAKNGSFKHRDEMDASLFAYIYINKSSIIDSNVSVLARCEVFNAIQPLLKTGKTISKDDFKYFCYQIIIFNKLIK